ncbi:MAG: LamG-like jellyroll fold domain-containing protein, partial [Phycisphaeraceae bacterium]|nr:LamG-like jellyroll fold domain-containing protein [Phycisphaeraceae bacterium]
MKRDLTDAILAYLDGDLNDRQQAKLAARLKRDPEAGKLFVRLSRLHAHLPEVATLETAAGAVELAESGRTVLRRLTWQAAAAAVLLGAVTLGLFQLVRTPAPVPVLATVQNLVSAEWSGQPLNLGQTLSRGRLHLKSGFVHVRFNSGASVILEGPAEFELIDTNHGILHRGQLVADVPDEAVGFQVDTPKTKVIDLGTEFAVSVESSGSTEVHVLQGKVRTETSAGRDSGQLLEENQARRFDNDRPSESIRAEPTRFVRSLPQPAPEDVGYVHWSFDRLVEDRVPDLGRNMEAGPYDARLAHLKKNGDRPRLVSGPFGKAISLDGKGQHLETDFAGIGGSEARTIAFWVRVPADAQERNAVSMVSWGSFQDGGAAWQISWNWIEKDGPIGHLRTGMYHGQIIGTTDLRDGRWHHIAVVMYAGKGEGEPIRSASLPGIVLDDASARKVGAWKKSTHVKGYVDAGYIHDSAQQRGRKSVV